MEGLDQNTRLIGCLILHRSKGTIITIDSSKRLDTDREAESKCSLCNASVNKDASRLQFRERPALVCGATS
jgi:hypothetical protein